MQRLNEFLSQIESAVWGAPLIIILVGTGLYLTIRLGFLQIRYIGYGLRIAFGFSPKEAKSHHERGDISYFQSLATALSATVGTGNIVGVAGAILLGGPGALFWMWVTAVVGMATKYSEAVLAVKYREKTARGYSGGPMYYIEKALNMRWLGMLFAFFTLIAAFGIGNMVQINAAAGALKASSLEIPVHVTSIVISLVVGLVIIGGIRRIGRLAAVMVPFMALFYMGGVLTIIGMNIDQLYQALKTVMYYAFEPLPAATGVTAGLLVTVQTGVSRGLFSNEAGLGSAPMAAASAKTDYAVKQGLVSMLGPFFDTLIICTLTGLTVIIGFESAAREILSSIPGALKSGFNSSEVWASLSVIDGAAIQDVFTPALFNHYFGPHGETAVSIGMFLFAVSTIIGWYHYSDRALIYLGGERYIPAYRIIYVILIFIGGTLPDQEFVWTFSAIANGFMAFPNLLALLLLSNVVALETKKYFRKFPHRHDLAIQFYVLLLRLLPKNTVSKFMGILAGLQLPRFMMIPVILAFARTYKININEAELELQDYKSINKFFTRALKNGSRLVSPENHVAVSPVDGTLLAFGDLEDGRLMQSKGRDSSLAELLGTGTFFDRFIGGKYMTVYLSPQDYHRIHHPTAGRIVGYYYQPGKLFPVNQIAVETINRLFSRNERLITYVETKFGLVAIVKVGATSVGRIKVAYDDHVSTNKWIRLAKEHFYKEPMYVQKGDELGRFEMGSTVMLLFEKNSVEFLELEARQKVRFGQPIAEFNRAHTPQPVTKILDIE